MKRLTHDEWKEMSASDEKRKYPLTRADFKDSLEFHKSLNEMLEDDNTKMQSELSDLKAKLQIAESNMTDVRSELTHAKENIDVSWCIDLLTQALQQIRKGG